MIDLDTIETAASRHAGDPAWAGAAIAYRTHVTPEVVLELVSTIREREAALAGVQSRMGGVLVVQAGLVGALNYALLNLRGEERDVDGVEHKARLALAAAEVVL